MRRAAFLLGLVLLAGLMACAVDETATPLAPPAETASLAAAAAGAGGAYPLQMGNRWTYQSETVFTRILDEGGPQPPEVVHRRTVREITGSETFFGRCYVAERTTLVEDVGDGEPVDGWIWYRQDRAGLYEADVPQVGLAAVSERPDLRRPDAGDLWQKARQELRRRMDLARSLGAGRPVLAKGRPGGVMEQEIQRLAYPLHPGQEWTVRDQPAYVSWVDGRENLDLPGGRTPAWRIGVRSPVFGENDWFFFYYGKDGFLGLRGHAETELTKEDGEPIGRLILDDQEWLESAEIHREADPPCSGGDLPDKPRDVALQG